MTVLPLAECCQLLAIDPKTVRHWVKLSRMSLVSHPTDARVKCLTEEHVHQLATTHARPIALPKALAHSPGEEARAAQHALGLLQEQTQRDELPPLLCSSEILGLSNLFKDLSNYH